MKYSDESWKGREEKAISMLLIKYEESTTRDGRGIEYKLNTVGFLQEAIIRLLHSDFRTGD